MTSAHDDAGAAAERSRVTIELARSLADNEAVSAVLTSVWGMGPGQSVAEVGLLVALSHTDGYVSIARDATSGEVVGGSFGFVCTHHGRLGLHSHVTGVTSSDRGIGAALKLHQRAWAIDTGITEITWTFDPLIRRNARFNLAVLGARITEYLPNFYGRMDDGFNTGEETDRAFTTWDLATATPRTSTAPAAQDVSPAPDAEVALSITDDGLPLAHATTGDHLLVALPPDIVALRRSDPTAAHAWRHAVRAALLPAFQRGLTVETITDDGHLVVAPPRP